MRGIFRTKTRDYIIQVDCYVGMRAYSHNRKANAIEIEKIKLAPPSHITKDFVYPCYPLDDCTMKYFICRFPNEIPLEIIIKSIIGLKRRFEEKIFVDLISWKYPSKAV